MSRSAKQITGAIAAALTAWVLFGLMAGVAAAAIGLLVVLYLNREPSPSDRFKACKHVYDASGRCPQCGYWPSSVDRSPGAASA